MAVLGRLLLRPKIIPAYVTSSAHSTPTMVMAADVMTGGFDENAETWRLTSKKATTCTWTGPSADEFNLFLNGYFLDTWLEKKRRRSTHIQAILAKSSPSWSSLCGRLLRSTGRLSCASRAAQRGRRAWRRPSAVPTCGTCRQGGRLPTTHLHMRMAIRALVEAQCPTPKAL